MKRHFIITIDTEGDNIWMNRAGDIRTENALFLPRFQALCEKHDLIPTYLVNYEMAADPRFVEFARDAADRGKAEIGCHIHAWNSPPLHDLTGDDCRWHPFLTDYPPQVREAKLRFMTDVLEERFGRKMTSHRGGRWAFDPTYARLLIAMGYVVDCSVTPYVNWRQPSSAPVGWNGPDFTGFPIDAYYVDPSDIGKSADSPLLEVPMTIRPRRGLVGNLARLSFLPARVRNRWGAPLWLRPARNNIMDILRLMDYLRGQSTDYAMFMLHSSEFMPGGSPVFSDSRWVECLYDDLELIFSNATKDHRGTSLTDYAAAFRARTRGISTAARPVEVG